MEKQIILKAAELPDDTVAELDRLFDMHVLPKDPAAASAMLDEIGPKVRGLALRKVKVDAAMLDRLPALEIISSYSAGLDNLDVAAAKARGIEIVTTSDILVDDVANAAVGLAVAITRDFRNADDWVRSGDWQSKGQFRLTRSISRMKVGIVGFGTIGSAVARRLEAMGSQIAYYGPRPKPVSYRYHSDITTLASESDMLILTCPLSDATHHLIDAKVLAALGPRGFLVNVARGPVVDEAALLEALQAGGLAGAALDVFEQEPVVPQALIDDPRVILTPHLGSGTEETRQAMADNVVRALAGHLGALKAAE